MTIDYIAEKLQNSEDPVAKALHIGDNFKVLIFGFRKGMEIQEHEVYHPTKLLVMSGKMLYKQGESEKTLTTFQEMEIPLREPHTIQALEESFVLLTQG